MLAAPMPCRANSTRPSNRWLKWIRSKPWPRPSSKAARPCNKAIRSRLNKDRPSRSTSSNSRRNNNSKPDRCRELEYGDTTVSGLPFAVCEQQRASTKSANPKPLFVLDPRPLHIRGIWRNHEQTRRQEESESKDALRSDGGSQ